MGQVTQCSGGGCGTGYTMKQRGLWDRLHNVAEGVVGQVTQ